MPSKKKHKGRTDVLLFLFISLVFFLSASNCAPRYCLSKRYLKLPSFNISLCVKFNWFYFKRFPEERKSSIRRRIKTWDASSLILFDEQKVGRGNKKVERRCARESGDCQRTHAALYMYNTANTLKTKKKKRKRGRRSARRRVFRYYTAHSGGRRELYAAITARVRKTTPYRACAWKKWSDSRERFLAQHF